MKHPTGNLDLPSCPTPEWATRSYIFLPRSGDFLLLFLFFSEKQESMENIQQKVTALKESLRSLNIEPVQEQGNNSSKFILVGKVLATRAYRRFTIADISTKIWRLKHPIKVEKLEANIFKFQFGCKPDRDHVYHLRPWSLDGAHLILKLWPDNKVLREILFDATTLWLQIHGLPPAIIHQGTAEKIGSRVGILHRETVNRSCVVAHRYLRVRVSARLTLVTPLLQSHPNKVGTNGSFFPQSLETYQVLCIQKE